MSDGQTQACEANVEPRCVRLERGESVKFQDADGGWHVGAVLMRGDSKYDRIVHGRFREVLVATAIGIYVVLESALEPYPPRCERCGGEGTVTHEKTLRGADGMDDLCIGVFKVPCPECGGSGRRKHD